MFQLIKNKSFWNMIFVFAAGITLTASVCFADDAINKIKKIEKPTKSTVVNHPHEEMGQGSRYDFEGTLDAIGDNWVTISDKQFTLEPGTRAGGNVGSYVGIIFSDRGYVESCKSIRRR